MQSVTDSFSVTYDAAPETVSVARGELATFAQRVGGSEIADAVKLAVSEAVTNSVLHAYRGGPGKIQVTAAVAGSELWVLVADEGGGLHPEPHRPGLGLGLGLISQVCDEMAIVARSGGGTEVRIRFELIPDRRNAHRASRPIAPGQLTVSPRCSTVAAHQSED